MARFTITPISPAARLFRLRSTGRVHRVRRAQRVVDGQADESWTSLRFHCDGIAMLSAGRYADRMGPGDLMCSRCWGRVAGERP